MSANLEVPPFLDFLRVMRWMVAAIGVFVCASPWLTGYGWIWTPVADCTLGAALLAMAGYGFRANRRYR